MKHLYFTHTHIKVPILLSAFKTFCVAYISTSSYILINKKAKYQWLFWWGTWFLPLHPPELLNAQSSLGKSGSLWALLIGAMWWPCAYRHCWVHECNSNAVSTRQCLTEILPSYSFIFFYFLWIFYWFLWISHHVSWFHSSCSLVPCFYPLPL